MIAVQNATAQFAPKARIAASLSDWVSRQFSVGGPHFWGPL